VGMVPTTATIGAAAPLILITLRVLQGFAVGGEWAGSALLSAEHAPTAQRGRYGMFTPLGGGVALVLSSLVFLGVNATIGETSAAFLRWGWRIPFLISAVLIVIALYVRLNIDETPVFAGEKARRFGSGAVVSEAPIKEVLRREHRRIALAAGSVVSGFGFVYMASTYLARYAQSQLGHSRTLILLVGVLGGLASIAFVAVSASLSDRVGRRRMMLVGRAASLPWSLVVIPLMDSGRPALYAVAIVGMYAVGAIAAGPTASFVPELFATRYRYTGTALATNLAGIFGGALPPLIGGTLLATYGSWSLTLMLATLVSISLVSTYLLPETNRTAFA
jgi:MFS family permease